MFIELTFCHTGEKVLVNINQITDIDRDENEKTIINFDENNHVYVEEPYEEIKRKLAMIGELL